MAGLFKKLLVFSVAFAAFGLGGLSCGAKSKPTGLWKLTQVSAQQIRSGAATQLALTAQPASSSKGIFSTLQASLKNFQKSKPPSTTPAFASGRAMVGSTDRDGPAEGPSWDPANVAKSYQGPRQVFGIPINPPPSYEANIGSPGGVYVVGSAGGVEPRSVGTAPISAGSPNAPLVSGRAGSSPSAGSVPVGGGGTLPSPGSSGGSNGVAFNAGGSDSNTAPSGSVATSPTSDSVSPSIGSTNSGSSGPSGSAGSTDSGPTSPSGSTETPQLPPQEPKQPDSPTSPLDNEPTQPSSGTGESAGSSDSGESGSGGSSGETDSKDKSSGGEEEELELYSGTEDAGGDSSGSTESSGSSGSTEVSTGSINQNVAIYDGGIVGSQTDMSAVDFIGLSPYALTLPGYEGFFSQLVFTYWDNNAFFPKEGELAIFTTKESERTEFQNSCVGKVVRFIHLGEKPSQVKDTRTFMEVVRSPGGLEDLGIMQLKVVDAVVVRSEGPEGPECKVQLNVPVEKAGSVYVALYGPLNPLNATQPLTNTWTTVDQIEQGSQWTELKASLTDKENFPTCLLARIGDSGKLIGTAITTFTELNKSEEEEDTPPQIKLDPSLIPPTTTATEADPAPTQAEETDSTFQDIRDVPTTQIRGTLYDSN